jgi:hypothetical protein
MRNSNFRNNQMMLNIYVMGIEAGIEMDDVDETFLNKGMTIAFETSNFTVRKFTMTFLFSAEKIEEICIQ